jgi:hypothetical protein
MNGSSRNVSRLLLPFGSLLFCASLMATPSTRYQDQQLPDNTKNKDQTSPTD